MTALAFDPLFDWAVLAGLGGLAAAAAALCALRRARGGAWRAAALAALWLALANPVLVEEEREPVADLVTVVVDESPSQRIDGRAARAEDALREISERLEAMDGVELRIVRAGARPAGAAASGSGTELFGPLARSLADVPRRRMAATVLLTDGQVHDAPGRAADLPFAGPLHVLLTGRRAERDRILFVDAAPAFALVGGTAKIGVRVEDDGAGGSARVALSQDGRAAGGFAAPVGAVREVEVEIGHAGPNVFELEAAGRPGELTMVNNRALVEINGVRERLRVLLISGEPHPGERVWRNFLKADPSVDLVHFTILRPPGKPGVAPVRELALIAFPVRELFEVKLDDFDLVIFDRYRRLGVLPDVYLENVARYVERGGAVLEAAGPAFASERGLYRSALGGILPGAPTGRVFERGFKPVVSDVGGRHPVTAELPGADGRRSRWGRWFRQVEVGAARGRTLMLGADSRPLLIVDRVGEGRVAQLLSDHIWLWARGFETGGPHSRILRRLAHWLMKEPELEERGLRAVLDRRGLTIVRRSLDPGHPPVEVVAPSGARRTVTLTPGAGGRALATIPADETGLYRVSDGERTALAASGALDPREYADMRSTPDRLAALVRATGGGLRRIEDGLPSFRRVRPGRLASGGGWFGLVANRGYRVARMTEAPVLPAAAVLALALGALALAWRREGG